MNRTIQDCFNFASIAEHAERYEDMVKHAKDAIRLILDPKQQCEVSEQAARLIASAFKCKINSRRTAWRAIELLQSKDLNPKSRSAAIIQLYKENIEKEIRQISQEAIAQSNALINSQKACCAVKVEIYKMKGDFHRYLCEIAKSVEEGKKLQKECENAYRRGIEQIKREKEIFKAYDARRLGIYLNLSVFYYEISSQTGKAIETCEEGFNSALDEISDLDEPKYTDSVTIMQLMHDNITSWKTETDKIVK